MFIHIQTVYFVTGILQNFILPHRVEFLMLQYVLEEIPI